jgi:hypothetical protein
MKTTMIVALMGLVVISAKAATPAAPDTNNPLICDAGKPVKLFVSFVYLDKNRTRPNFGNTYMCWDKEVDSQYELTRLHSEFKPRAKGDETLILSVMKLRN